MSEQGQSIDEIEAEIKAARARLAGTIDELAYRAQPQQIVARQKESLMASFADATRAVSVLLQAFIQPAERSAPSL